MTRRRRRRPVRDADAALLSRTALHIGVQAGALVAVIVLVLALLAGYLVLHQQHNSSNALLQQAIANADDVTDPPAGVWLSIQRGAELESTSGLPKGLPDIAALAEVARTGRTLQSNERVGGREYRVRTGPDGTAVVQAVLDLRVEHEQRNHLLFALFSVGTLGLLAAAVTGALLGRRAVRPLADALRRQRTFVADASHELKTPLTLLSTRAQLLYRELEAADVAGETLADAAGVVTDAQNLGLVVDDLLLAADPRDLVDFEPVDLRVLAEQVVASASGYALERGLTLLCEPGDAVDTGRIDVGGSVSALRRALVALIDNAIEHTPSGGQVTVRVARENERARLSVLDTGPGVDPAGTEALFARFASGSQRSSRRRYGLGLALVQDIATRHHGTITVAPRPAGSGAEFVLTLPLHP